jgi:hypothetical protein
MQVAAASRSLIRFRGRADGRNELGCWQVPEAAMSEDEQRCAWALDEAVGWLRRGACFTFIRGLDENEVIRRFGGDSPATRSTSLPEPMDVDLYGAGARVPRGLSAPTVSLVVESVGDWVVVAERAGWQGAIPDVLAVAVGAEVITVYWDGLNSGSFLYAAGGKLVTGFELGDSEFRHGSEPDRLLAVMQGLAFDEDRGVVAGLALAGRLTGAWLTQSWVVEPHRSVVLPPGSSDGYRYVWLDGDPEFDWLRMGVCFTFVRGLDEQEVIRRFRGDMSTSLQMSLAKVSTNRELVRARFDLLGHEVAWTLVTDTVGGWVVVAEVNGWQGVTEEVVERVSVGTELASVNWNVNGNSRMLSAVDGEVVTELEPLSPAQRWGRDPNRLADQMRFLPLGLGSKYRGAGLALASRISGVWLTPAWMTTPHRTVLLEDGVV